MPLTKHVSYKLIHNVCLSALSLSPAVSSFCLYMYTGHRRAVSIACGQTSSMAVLDNGDVGFPLFVFYRYILVYTCIYLYIPVVIHVCEYR